MRREEKWGCQLGVASLGWLQSSFFIACLNQGHIFLSLFSSISMNFLGAKSTSILDCVGWLVGRSVPHDARLRGKIIVTSRLIREEEEEETDFVAIPLRRVLCT
jgi:hypothetical protein